MQNPSRTVAALLCVVLACMPQRGIAAGSGGVNADHQRDKPHLVLVSLDGFGWDLMDKHETPALDRLASDGVRAKSLEPVFPTLTFPNHYSIATGLYPAEHGLVGNTFPSAARDDWYTLRDRSKVEDGNWYEGEPIWVTAEKQGMVSAAFFFVGTEADIDGIRPTYWNTFNYSVPGEQRVGKVLDWLALPDETRPRMITLYFEYVDQASHDEGPDSAGAARAVARVDALIGRLLQGIDKLGMQDDVYVVVVSDHGQAGYRDNREAYVLDEHIDLDGIDIVEHGSFAGLYFEDTSRIDAIVRAVNATWDDGTAYTRATAPLEWHITADRRFADVYLVADPGEAVISTHARLRTLTAGDHGWAPSFTAMHGLFIASGPRLSGVDSIDTISVTDVYPLMLGILGLEAPAGHPERGLRLRNLLEPTR